jgi:hypothetical protein
LSANADNQVRQIDHGNLVKPRRALLSALGWWAKQMGSQFIIGAAHELHLISPSISASSSQTKLEKWAKVIKFAGIKAD